MKVSLLRTHCCANALLVSFKQCQIEKRHRVATPSAPHCYPVDVQCCMMGKGTRPATDASGRQAGGGEIERSNEPTNERTSAGLSDLGAQHGCHGSSRRSPLGMTVSPSTATPPSLLFPRRCCCCCCSSPPPAASSGSDPLQCSHGAAGGRGGQRRERRGGGWWGGQTERGGEGRVERE